MPKILYADDVDNRFSIHETTFLSKLAAAISYVANEAIRSEKPASKTKVLPSLTIGSLQRSRRSGKQTPDYINKHSYGCFIPVTMLSTLESRGDKEKQLIVKK